eukprot:7259512-Pyramimonas_sp.AAC.1
MTPSIFIPGRAANCPQAEQKKTLRQNALAMRGSDDALATALRNQEDVGGEELVSPTPRPTLLSNTVTQRLLEASGHARTELPGNNDGNVMTIACDRARMG